MTRRNVATRGYGMCAVVERASGAVIGFCGLVHPGGQPEAELKYALRREHWGRGYASAALTAFLEIETRRPLRAYVVKHNVGSQRVLEKAGFTRLSEESDGFTYGA